MINLKKKHGNGKVHLQAIQFPDKAWGIYNQRNRPDIWGHWALCGGAGCVYLKPTKETANCKACLLIAEKIKTGKHTYTR